MCMMLQALFSRIGNITVSAEPVNGQVAVSLFASSSSHLQSLSSSSQSSLRRRRQQARLRCSRFRHSSSYFPVHGFVAHAFLQESLGFFFSADFNLFERLHVIPDGCHCLVHKIFERRERRNRRHSLCGLELH